MRKLQKHTCGKNGQDGKDGKNGLDGKNGKDGKNGLDGKNGKDGKNGVDGKNGMDGKDSLRCSDRKHVDWAEKGKELLCKFQEKIRNGIPLSFREWVVYKWCSQTKQRLQQPPKWNCLTGSPLTIPVAISKTKCRFWGQQNISQDAQQCGAFVMKQAGHLLQWKIQITDWSMGKDRLVFYLVHIPKNKSLSDWKVQVENNSNLKLQIPESFSKKTFSLCSLWQHGREEWKQLKHDVTEWFSKLSFQAGDQFCIFIQGGSTETTFTGHFSLDVALEKSDGSDEEDEDDEEDDFVTVF
jgi:hypothetical protein